MDFAVQAQSIKALTKKYTMKYIGVDATGIGQGVFQLVSQFFPAAREIKYSPQVKRRWCSRPGAPSPAGVWSTTMDRRTSRNRHGYPQYHDRQRQPLNLWGELQRRGQLRRRAWVIIYALLNEPLTAASGSATPSILEF